MGNCIRKDEAVQWGGDDWGTSFSHDHGRDIEEEEKGLLKHGSFSHVSSSSASSSERNITTTEVKIKITKKQLEELVGEIDIQGLSVQQVLNRLTEVSDGFESHQRPWRPALSSIPEAS